MEAWTEPRTVIALVALAFSVVALILSRRDRGNEQQRAALNRIESTLKDRIESEKAVADARHDGSSSRLGHIEVELSRISEAIKHFPSQGSIDLMRKDLGSLSAAVAKIEGLVTTSDRTVERLQQYLMEQGK